MVEPVLAICKKHISVKVIYRNKTVMSLPVRQLKLKFNYIYKFYLRYKINIIYKIYECNTLLIYYLFKVKHGKSTSCTPLHSCKVYGPSNYAICLDDGSRPLASSEVRCTQKELVTGVLLIDGRILEPYRIANINIF